VDSPFASTPLPDWAIAQARALPRAEGNGPATVQRLVAQGLSPEAAAEVVEKVLEERIRQQLEPLAQAERRTRIHRLASGFVAVACVVLAYGFFGTWSACQTGLKLLLPVACIWFADEMGGYTSKYSFSGTVPGLLIRWCGWLLLVVIAIMILGLGIALPRA
jgi:hypothetical protein